MDRTSALLIKDIHNLRRRIQSFESSDGQECQEEKLWKLMKNCARTAPDRFPWFTPFVALMTMEDQDILNAKSVLRDYIDKLEPMYFTSGLQYHFWCFAFPHAKWSLYFQWMATMSVFTQGEENYIREALIRYQFTNFFYGMRTKPEPECIDNQTLSLCLSNVLVGHLFSSGDSPSMMAQTMLEEGLRRLPGIIGGIPASGYTGEGSAYMDEVVAPAVPLVVELMAEITGEEDIFFRAFAPNGVTPERILRMAAREWMPGGLLLPWDNYGYQYGVRAPIAYAALKTGEPLYADILHKHAVWSYDIGVGWAYDDLVWSFIWWPEDNINIKDQGSSFSWPEREVGGVITAHHNDYYMMQMWDSSEPIIPTRSHVNPNAVLFNAYGVPLTLDGTITKSCQRFKFADTWRETTHSVGEVTRYNYGDGCGGAHSVLLVDNWEGMRACKLYEQHHALELDHDKGVLAADVAPIYRERFQDAVHVCRRSTVAADRFFVIEDDARFSSSHMFTSRFVLRPSLVSTQNGVKIETQEGITLHLMDLLGNTSASCEKVEGTIFYYPMDMETLLVDFNGTSGKRLFVAFMSRTFEPTTSEAAWKVVYDESEKINYQDAWVRLLDSRIILPFNLPAYMEDNVPVVKRWWYYKKIKKRNGKARLQLPRGMSHARVWINHKEVLMDNYNTMLLAPTIQIPSMFEDAEEIHVVIRTDVPTSHFDGKGEGTIGLNGGVAMCYPCEEEQIINARFLGDQIEVLTNLRHYSWPYKMMEG